MNAAPGLLPLFGTGGKLQSVSSAGEEQGML